jgi:D-alanyl-D-alanine carboxypeptidase
MIRLFTRRSGASVPTPPCSGSAPPRGPLARTRRRARLAVEELDPRLLMASGAASPDLSDRVAQALAPYFAQDQFPGISVAVVTDGQVALAQGYGVSNAATKAPVEPDTRFDIGSVTKTFTAVGVLLLYQESQGTSHALNLNAPISKYLHNTKSFKLPPKWANITTSELLDMTSGIKNIGTAQPWQVQLNSVAKDRLLFAPGTESYYSNANYYLLGELIQQWTGESYSTFIQNEILGPLGMSSTEELGGSARVSNQAVGYSTHSREGWSKAPVQNGSEMYAAAGMVSTAQDMATYMTALLSGKILDPATYALMWSTTPTPQYGLNPPADAVRGLGWDIVVDTSNGPSEVTKGGEVPGYTSELVLYPGSDSGIFVSFNSRNPRGVSALQVAEAIHNAIQT